MKRLLLICPLELKREFDQLDLTEGERNECAVAAGREAQVTRLAQLRGIGMSSGWVSRRLRKRRQPKSSSDAMCFTERAKLQELMQTTRLPVAYELRDHVLAGGLLSYGYDATANYRDAARYMDKILKGARPVDLPVEQTTKFKLVVNLKTAKALSLTVPQSLLLRADEVIR